MAETVPGGAADGVLDYLLGPQAIRDRTRLLFDLCEADQLENFRCDRTRLDTVTDFVLDTIQQNYPDFEVPFHSRWRHFNVGGVNRLPQLNQALQGLSPDERAKAKLDLAIVSVLLDAGAGRQWQYRDAAAGQTLTRSEGLAIASFNAFMQGTFSCDTDHPYRVDAQGLQQLTEAALAEVSELEQVFEIVLGGGETGAQVVTNVDAICFTGSVATGRKVGAAAAQAFIPAFLELGGKDPAVVLESADIDRATTALLRGSIANTGQACQSIERIYVAESIADAFEAQLVEKANAVTLNAQDMQHGQLGPFIFEQQAKIVGAQLEDAKSKGARVLAGGTVEDHGGQWLRPTVLAGVSTDMAVMTEETFGPVLPITRFDSVDDAVAMANDSQYGLSGAVFAGTVDEAEEVAARLDVGAVSINDASLTSMMYEAEKNSFKLSGLGASRMGASGLTRFLRKQAILINEGAVAPIAAFDEANAG